MSRDASGGFEPPRERRRRRKRKKGSSAVGSKYTEKTLTFGKSFVVCFL